MTQRIKCAIYTRKSSEEGLDQSFNSLDAQREACEAYIRSQKHEGWTALTTKYDDGGFSGGNMERPALKMLIDDIAAGKVNTVVVYKVDRLTRSLHDFAKIIDQFDSKGVTFVSITQQFNTTTSMGRLTLNVLLSFAQFEREVTGERIRDKIAASKAKGMWMGGAVPLGYDLRDHKLHINIDEAELVREVYRQYLRLGNVAALVAYFRESGGRPQSQNGTNSRKAGHSFSRGGLYRILRNRIYLGEIEHKGAVYPGEHEGILDRELWEQVQKLFTQNLQGDRVRSRATSGSLLTGLLFDASGDRYIPTHAQKGSARYHYYTSQALIAGEKKGDGVGRLPAPPLERAVADRIQAFFNSPAELLKALKQGDVPEVDYDNLLRQAKQVSSKWDKMGLWERARRIRTILNRVIPREGVIELQLNIEAIVNLLLGKPPEELNTRGNTQVFSLEMSFVRTRHGKALKLVIGNDRTDRFGSRDAIAKAIARARSWYDMIVKGKAISLLDLSRQLGLGHRYVKNIFPLALLAPECVEVLLRDDDNRPRTLESFLRKVPLRWDAQKKPFRHDSVPIMRAEVSR